MATGDAPTFNIVGYDFRRDELVSIVTALVAKRVSASTVLTGTARTSAVGIVADAKLIQAELDKQAPAERP